MKRANNDETIKDILVVYQALMSLDKGQITQVTIWNHGSKSIRRFKRIR